jgi:hypothetical protein
VAPAYLLAGEMIRAFEAGARSKSEAARIIVARPWWREFLALGAWSRHKARRADPVDAILQRYKTISESDREMGEAEFHRLADPQEPDIWDRHVQWSLELVRLRK